jgi:uncharacterized protein (TIGR02145 family)
MKKRIRNSCLAIAGYLAICWGCDTKNDFHEVGRQPVHLVAPRADTTWVLDYQAPDSLFRFQWESTRYFIDFKLIVALDDTLSEQRVEIPTGIKRDVYFTTMQVDSILSAMNIGIAESADVYWSVLVVDPDVGWCNEVRKINITRCDLPTNVIALGQPANLEEIRLDKSRPDSLLVFTWDCPTPVTDYRLQLGFDALLADPLEIARGSEKSHAYSHQYIDSLLRERGIGRGESDTLYWRVKGSGNLNNPLENSATGKFLARRFGRDPVEVALTKPIDGSQIALEVATADEMVTFEWECDTTGVHFTLKLYDTEIGAVETFDAGDARSFSISQVDMDQLLEQTFEMVASQKKKIYWEVIPDDPSLARSDTVGQFTIRRFPAILLAQPITLTAAPSGGTAYTLNHATPGAILATVTWDCDAFNVTYALEYSLNADMSQSRVWPLNKTKSVDLTHLLLDDMLSNAGAAYLTKTLYWRITSTINVQTVPSETRNVVLTGMLKPLVDARDPENPETYTVVKIGTNFWMAENLRATRYSDGTAFTAIDVPSKSYNQGAVADPSITGQYYTWPTALRTWELANESDNTIIQGACPDGWHVSTKAEWDAVVVLFPSTTALAAKSVNYWAAAAGITNSSGLNIVPAGVFWHNNLSLPDNGGSDGKAAFWTTTTGAANTAFMYEFFDWRQDIAPWNYPCRPWSEGDGTASRLVNVRCVRTLE